MLFLESLAVDDVDVDDENVRETEKLKKTLIYYVFNFCKW